MLWNWASVACRNDNMIGMLFKEDAHNGGWCTFKNLNLNPDLICKKKKS